MKENTYFKIDEKLFPTDKEKSRVFYTWSVLLFSLMLFYTLSDINGWKLPVLVFIVCMYFIWEQYKEFNQTFVKTIDFNFNDKFIEMKYQHHFNKDDHKMVPFKDLKYSIGYSSKTYNYRNKKVLEFYCENEFLANIRLDGYKNGWNKEDLDSLIVLLNSIDEIEQIPPEFPNHI